MAFAFVLLPIALVIQSLPAIASDASMYPLGNLDSARARVPEGT